MKNMLADSKVYIQYVSFVNYEKEKDYQDFYKNESKMKWLIQEKGFRNIFFDEAEDLGIEEVFRICRTSHSNKDWMTGEQYEGYFWILFDPYQSKLDQHGLGEDKSRQTKEDTSIWIGNTMDSNLLSNVVQLRTIFRTTGSIANYIGENYLVLNWKIGEEDGDYKITHNIRGIDPEVRKDVKLESLDDEYVKHKLLTCFESFIEQSVKDKNIHPGNVAIILPDPDFHFLFGNDLSKIVTELNVKISSKYNRPEIAPQISTNIQESLLDKHDANLSKCNCKTYLGSVSSVKGLTIPIVHYQME